MSCINYLIINLDIFMHEIVKIRWIDQAKGISIMLVVIVHTLGDLNIFMSQYKFIYAFNMPLSFVLSGYVWSSKIKNFSIYYELKRNFKQLLVPYLFFGFLSYYILVSFRCEMSKELDWHGLIMPIMSLLVGLDARLSCETIKSGALINAPLWFFPCLFVTRMIYFALTKFVKNDFIVLGYAIIISVLGHLYYYFDMPRLPMHIDVALLAILFFAIGVFCRSRDTIAVGNVIGIKFLVVSLFVFIMFYLTASNNPPVSLAGPYGSIPLFYIAAITGSWLVIILARGVNSSLVRYLGIMSIVIFPTHDFIAQFIYIPKVIGMIDWYSIKVSELLPWFNVKYAYLGYQVIMEIVLSCLLGMIFIRFVPVVIGSRYRHKCTNNR